MKKVESFLRSVLAGMMITVGCVVFLSVENEIAGAVLFSVGLLTVLLFDLNLYTGKIGYLLDGVSPGFLFMVWLGNLVGTLAAGGVVRFTRIFSGLEERLSACVAARENDSFLSLFILAVFCGLLMFVAVDSFKASRIVGIPVVIFCVSVFILCGFEHCVADMGYLSLAASWSPVMFLKIVVITLGNSLGGLLIPALRQLSRRAVK